MSNRTKRAIAFAALLLAAPSAVGDDCYECGPYSGTAFTVGSCIVINMFAICAGGVCNISGMQCPDGGEVSESCNC